jgi:hypothetical protein
MKIKIIGVTGTYGTQVVNAETGEKIEQVRSVTWTHRAGEPPIAVIECYAVVADVEAILDGKSEITLDVPDDCRSLLIKRMRSKEIGKSDSPLIGGNAARP